MIQGITPKEFEKKTLEQGKYRKLVFAVSEELIGPHANWLWIAESFVQKNPLYYDKAGIWWSWNWSKDIYEIIDETALMIMIDQATKRYSLKTSIKSEILEGLKRAARQAEPKEPPLEWIQFGETIYNYKTKETIKATPEYFFTNSIPWDVGETEETPTIDKLFTDWVGENKEQLYEIIAYSTIRDYPIHALFVLLGSGSNGKSTYMKILKKFIGEDNIASADLDQLSDNSFQVAKLYKKLLCLMGETNFDRMKKTSLIKALTGGDLVNIEYKNKKAFDAVNYAKIVIGTNSLPESHDKTDGFYRRWIIIDFKKQFTDKRDILSEIPNEEYKNLAKKSLRLITEIIERRTFSRQGTIAERKARYEERSDPLNAFLSQYERDHNSMVPASQFYDDLSAYLIVNGYRGLTYNVVRSMMKEAGYEYEKHRVPGFENPVACIPGLKKKPVIKSEKQSEEVYSLPDNQKKDLLLSEQCSSRSNCSSSSSWSPLQETNRKVEDLLEHLEHPEFIDAVKEFLLKNPKENAFDFEEKFGTNNVNKMILKGIIIELPYGTYRLL